MTTKTKKAFESKAWSLFQSASIPACKSDIRKKDLQDASDPTVMRAENQSPFHA